jgi:aminoglycoside phosphotransferase (APT) family kinase protein
MGSTEGEPEDSRSASAPFDTESVDVLRLQRWLVSEFGRNEAIEVERMGQGVGVANALFDVRWGDEHYVLRRPPAIKVTRSAGQTLREARILRALKNTDVPHPRLVAVCEDQSVIGTPFLLMARIDGFTAVDPLPGSLAADLPAKRALGLGIVEALSKLSTVDWRAVGLEGFGKPAGFLARQVDRWLWQLETYRSRLIPHEEALVAWLREHLPASGPIGIMHGDYSMFNVMFTFDVAPELAAIVDWDTATIGEPLMDFGHLLSRWDEAGEEPTHLGSSDIADRTGMSTRAEMTELYAGLTGFDLSNSVYYQVLALFKLGCILEGHYANARAAGTSDEENRSTQAAPSLFRDAMRIASGRRS